MNTITSQENNVKTLKLEENHDCCQTTR